MNYTQQFYKFPESLREFKQPFAELLPQVTLEEDAAAKFEQAMEKVYSTKENVTLFLEVKCELEQWYFPVWMKIFDAYVKRTFNLTKVEWMHRSIFQRVSHKSPYTYEDLVSIIYAKKNEQITLRIEFDGNNYEKWLVYRNLICYSRIIKRMQDYVKDSKGRELIRSVFQWLKEETGLQYYVGDSVRHKTECAAVDLMDIYMDYFEGGLCEAFGEAYHDCLFISGFDTEAKVIEFGKNELFTLHGITNYLVLDGETFYLSAVCPNCDKILWTMEELEAM